jgi:hypothetical protein
VEDVLSTSTQRATAACILSDLITNTREKSTYVIARMMIVEWSIIFCFRVFTNNTFGFTTVFNSMGGGGSIFSLMNTSYS